MSTAAAELEKYPKYRAAYIRAFERMLKERNPEKMRTVWNTGEEVMNWWLGYKIEKPLSGQIEIGGLNGQRNDSQEEKQA